MRFSKNIKKNVLKESKPTSKRIVANVTVMANDKTIEFAAIFADYAENYLGSRTEKVTTKTTANNVKVYLDYLAWAEDLLELCQRNEAFNPEFNDDPLLAELLAEGCDAHVQSVNFIFDFPEMRAFTESEEDEEDLDDDEDFKNVAYYLQDEDFREDVFDSIFEEYCEKHSEDFDEDDEDYKDEVFEKIDEYLDSWEDDSDDPEHDTAEEAKETIMSCWEDYID